MKKYAVSVERLEWCRYVVRIFRGRWLVGIGNASSSVGAWKVAHAECGWRRRNSGLAPYCPD